MNWSENYPLLSREIDVRLLTEERENEKGPLHGEALACFSPTHAFIFSTNSHRATCFVISEQVH